MEKSLLGAIGLADMCELMSVAWAFPQEDFARALRDGSFADDLAACLVDVGGSENANEVQCELRVFRQETEELFSNLRKGYSLLYLKPSPDTIVWPYEATFCAVEQGQDAPSIFRSPCQIDVERHMVEAGVRPKKSRQEPADSIWDEFSFLSYLYGCVASALHEQRFADASAWYGRIDAFWEAHASQWLFSFMRRTKEESSAQLFGKEYGVLATASLVVLETVASDVKTRRG